MTISIQEAIRHGVVIEHNDPADEEHWYHIQHFGKWYYILSCCRRCAAKNLHGWVTEFGTVKTLTSPPWLVLASEVEADKPEWHEDIGASAEEARRDRQDASYCLPCDKEYLGPCPIHNSKSMLREAEQHRTWDEE